MTTFADINVEGLTASSGSLSGNLNMNSNKKISTESQSSEKTPLIFQEKTFMSLHILEFNLNLSISLKVQEMKYNKKNMNTDK